MPREISTVLCCLSYFNCPCRDFRPEGEIPRRHPCSLREGFASVLRRTALSIMDKGGVVRKMENLGEQELPHRMRAHTEWHTHGRYFLMHFDLGTEGLKELKHELGTDTDLIRPRIIKVKSRYDSLKHRHSLLECWESYKPPSSFQPRS